VTDGCGLSLEEIMILNCRTELLSTTPMHECTSMAVLPPASGEVLLGQTWDWLEVMRGSAVVLRVRREDRPTVTMLVEAGQIGKMGYNSAGLGLCLNWMETDYQRIGAPYLLIARALLDCAHLSQAIDVFSKYPRASSGNYLLAHVDGVAINIEATPDQFDFQEPERGILVHTNHFISPRFRASDRGLRQEGGDSLVRRQHAANLLGREHGRITGDTLKAIQQDTAFGPAAICTPAPEHVPPLERWATLAGLVMNLTTQEHAISPGAGPESCYTPIPN
jgi:isopenicillin-N N-acyltransferase-like protein